jgi:hypothetical protein
MVDEIDYFVPCSHAFEGLDWQGTPIKSPLNQKDSWGTGLDEDLHPPWIGWIVLNLFPS